MRELDTVVSAGKKQHSISTRIIVGIVLLCFCIGLGGVLGVYNYRNQQYKKACASAELYYEACDYANAITAYQKALKYESQDEIELVIHLSNSYIALKNYEAATRILQDYYAKTDSIELRNKIDETVELLLNSEYASNIERGNRYSAAGEYGKAILEYQEAYRLKPESEQALELLIEAYLNNSEIEDAQRLYDEVKDKYSRDVILTIKKKIGQASLQQQYDMLLSEADEFFYNESYQECFDTYDQAIALLPTEMKAYEQLVETYISMQEYDTAKNIISKYQSKYQFMELNNLVDYIKQEQEMEEALSSLMQSLYSALSDGNMEEVMNLIHGEKYKTWIQEGTTYYYNAEEQRKTSQIPTRKGLVIYGSGYIYCGRFESAKRSGQGRYFGVSQDALGYFLYTGDWSEDLPNGEGTLNTVMDMPYNEERQQFVVVVQGIYRNGLENGRMRRDLYFGNNYFGSLEYRSLSGVPQASTISTNEYDLSNGYSYVIGNLVTIKGTEEFIYTSNEDKWKVPGV